MSAPFILFDGHSSIEIAAPNTPGSACVFVEILGDDLYRTDQWIHDLPSAPRIVDLGANFGLFSAWMRVRLPQSVVTAVEPNPEILRYLHANAERFRFDVVEAAVAREACEVLLSNQCDSTIAHVVSGECTEEPVAVAAITPSQLRELAAPRIDLLKSDCEGGESIWLENESLLNYVDRVVMEYHLSSVSRNWVRSKLSGLGFDILFDECSDVSGHLIAVRS